MRNRKERTSPKRRSQARFTRVTLREPLRFSRRRGPPTKSITRDSARSTAAIYYHTYIQHYDAAYLGAAWHDAARRDATRRSVRPDPVRNPPPSWPVTRISRRALLPPRPRVARVFRGTPFLLCAAPRCAYDLADLPAPFRGAERSGDSRDHKSTLSIGSPEHYVFSIPPCRRPRRVCLLIVVVIVIEHCF